MTETRHLDFDGHRLAYRVNGEGPALVVMSLYRREKIWSKPAFWATDGGSFRSTHSGRSRPSQEGARLWEPVAGCWTLHRTDDGQVLYDHAWPPPRPSPFTTIAWRLCHIGVGCLANRASRLFPETAPAPLITRMWEGSSLSP